MLVYMPQDGYWPASFEVTPPPKSWQLPALPRWRCSSGPANDLVRGLPVFGPTAVIGFGDPQTPAPKRCNARVKPHRQHTLIMHQPRRHSAKELD